MFLNGVSIWLKGSHQLGKGKVLYGGELNITTNMYKTFLYVNDYTYDFIQNYNVMSHKFIIEICRS